jgi:hypothetical protein
LEAEALSMNTLILLATGPLGLVTGSKSSVIGMNHKAIPKNNYFLPQLAKTLIFS